MPVPAAPPAVAKVPPAAQAKHAVTVTLTPQAQQLLKLLPSNHDQAAATSQLPANPWSTQSSR